MNKLFLVAVFTLLFCIVSCKKSFVQNKISEIRTHRAEEGGFYFPYGNRQGLGQDLLYFEYLRALSNQLNQNQGAGNTGNTGTGGTGTGGTGTGGTGTGGTGTGGTGTGTGTGGTGTGTGTGGTGTGNTGQSNILSNPWIYGMYPYQVPHVRVEVEREQEYENGNGYYPFNNYVSSGYHPYNQFGPRYTNGF